MELFPLREFLNFFLNQLSRIFNLEQFSTLSVNGVKQMLFRSVKGLIADRVRHPETFGLPRWNEEKYNKDIAPLVEHALTDSTEEHWQKFIEQVNAGDVYPMKVLQIHLQNYMIYLKET